MNPEFDLLGDPVPANFGGRGRPAHIPTQENRSKIRLLLAFGWSNRRIAQALRITTDTLKKHYFVELRQRDEARPSLEAASLMMTYKAAAEGNVSAIKELNRLIEKDELARPPARPPRAEARDDDEAKPERLGKKARAELEAKSAHEDTEWGELLKRPH